ncbi:MAG: DNA polymerase I, partial [Gammaproteobacteria bacterium]
HQASALNLETLISTADKDMTQLVNDHVRCINTMTDEQLDPTGVKAKFGVPPERIIDYLTLIGDTSDNIPGVPKVGPKTAVKWLDLYGDLDTIIARADEIKGKVGENLRGFLDQIELSRELVTIKCDVELDQSLEQLSLQSPDTDKLRKIYTELEFKTWLRNLDGGDDRDSAHSRDSEADEPSAGTINRDRYETLLELAELEKWIDKLDRAPVYAFDLETDSLDYMQARIVGFSFAVNPGEAAYLPLTHDYPGAPDQINLDKALALFKPLLESPQRKIIGQHFKYDMNVLKRFDIKVPGPAHDTMLESYTLDSTASRHDMDSLSSKHLGHTTITFKELAGTGKNQLTFNQIALEDASAYAAEDADITLRLHQTLGPKLAQLPGPLSIYEEVELPLVPVLSRIECHGVRVDSNLLKIQSGELASAARALEEEAHALADQPFNMASPKQIQEILFTKMEIPVIRKTPKGQPSTAEDVLQELAEKGYRLPELILEHRSLTKLQSTYTDKLPQMVDPDSGRVHTSYHQAVASTGRLSSSDPNLQNIPIRSAEGRRIRQAFIAAPGNQLLAADYSQIELRIMAHLSGDQGLLAAFAEGQDIHRATAAEVFGMLPDQVSSEQRRNAKAINFGLIYGMSAFGLGKQLGIGRGEAQSYIDLYFARYPGVRAYMDETREKARDLGYVETVMGRRLYLPEINARNAQRRQYAERTAINAPMQGTAADLIKRAMIRIDAWLAEQPETIKMIMQVHDELVFELPAEQIEAVRPQIDKLMTDDNPLKVPLEVEIGSGDNWDQAH